METRQRSITDVRSRLDSILDKVPEMAALQVKRNGIVFSRARNLLGRVQDERLEILLELNSDVYDRACRTMIAAVIHTVSAKPLVKIAELFEVSREEIQEMASNVTRPVNVEIIQGWLNAARVPTATRDPPQSASSNVTREEPYKPDLKSLKRAKRPAAHASLYSSLKRILDDVPSVYCAEGALKRWAGSRALNRARSLLRIIEDEGRLVKQLGERSLAEEEHKAIIAVLIRYSTRHYIPYTSIASAFGIETAKLQEMHFDVLHPILTDIARSRISDYLAFQGIMLQEKSK